MTGTPWAILLCKTEGTTGEPHPKTFYQQLLCQQGAGMGGAYDYWHDISYGAIDLSGSAVFGWFQVDYTPQQQMTMTFDDQLAKIHAVASASLDFKSFYGFVAIYNHQQTFDNKNLLGGWLDADLGNGNKTYGFVASSSHPLNMMCSAMAHEMGHGYGLLHPWSAMPNDVEAGDRFDVMSYVNCHMFQGPVFGSSGPGLIAPNLIKLGWLPDNRVLKIDPGTDLPYQGALAPLGHPEVTGPLAIRIDRTDQNGSPLTYLIEYRHQDGWDAGIPSDAVLLHEVRANDLSYLKASLGIYWYGGYMVEAHNFGVAVQSIDTEKRLAKILISERFVELEGEITPVPPKIQKKSMHGTYHFPGNMFCPKKSYSYTRHFVTLKADYTAVAETSFFEPGYKYTWSVNSSILKFGTGEAVVHVASTSAFPPPAGTTTYGHEAVLSYKLTANHIVLTARPEDANFSVTLRVEISDSKGHSAAAQLLLDFKGDVLTFGKQYYQDMHRCLMKRRAFISKKKKLKPKKPPTPGPYKKLKQQIAETVHEIVQLEPEQANELHRSFAHIPGMTFRPALRPTGIRLKRTRSATSRRGRSRH